METDFLDFLINLSNLKPRVELQINNLQLKAQFMEINGKLTLLNLRNLETPMGIVKEAQVKIKDVESITILEGI